MRKTLQDAFEHKDWGRQGVPRSGPGSTLGWTRKLRAAMPGLFERYEARRFLDAPCGDWFWMKEVDLTGIDYFGYDISSSVVAENEKLYGAPDKTFGVLDITSDPLPAADLMLCRDCLFHLQFWLRWEFFDNFVRSDIRYLLLTMNHNLRNKDLKENSSFKNFNPTKPPFSLPQPIEIIHETCEVLPDDIDTNWKVAVRHRSLGPWSRDQIVETLKARDMETPGGQA